MLAKSARIGWKTVWIPVVVALLIWSRIPWVSNPILYIIIGGVAGYIWLVRQEKKLSVRQIDKEEKEDGV